MIVLAGGDLVLPDRLLDNGSLVIDGGRIAAVEARRVDPARAAIVDASGCFVVPGFIDVHVHGIDGHDTLDGHGAVARIAALQPRYGVTAFCPTTVACAPGTLRAFLEDVGRARRARGHAAARVLPAHLESNFIHPEYRGAQPAMCLRSPLASLDLSSAALRHAPPQGAVRRDLADADGYARDAWTGLDILDVVRASAPDIGIITLAPELPGCLDLVRSFVRAGHIVSLGHSGADFDTAIAAIEAGARHATHLFNRMTPIAHRAPGLAGAILAREEVVAELICDGFHVHPAMCRVAMLAKYPRGIAAITDGTAGSGLSPGSAARLGGQAIHVGDQAAFLDDGTLAGSTLTMDRAFRNIVTRFGGSIVDAAVMCATTPARQLGLTSQGALVETAAADVVLLDRQFRVVRTFIEGEEAFRDTRGLSE